MHILYYISSHGFGHGVRATAICNRFSADTRLSVRTGLARSFFREELRCDFEYIRDEFDCGCVQSDGVTVDIKETVARYTAIAEKNRVRLASHVEWCRTHGVDIIITDIAPFACEVAREARIPSVAVSNFSWLDIYQPFVAHFPCFATVVEHIARQYAMADVLLALEPPNALEAFGRRESMPVVGRRGRSRRGEVLRHFGVRDDTKLGLIYTGIYGLDSASWKRLETFDGWVFTGLHDLPGRPSNYVTMPKSDFRYEDLCASADCVFSKLGYGVYAECLLNGVAVVYLPRDNFAEFSTLERSLRAWGHAYRLEREPFERLAWEETLERVVSSPKPLPRADTGALLCAQRIEQLARSHSNREAGNLRRPLG